MTNTYPFLRDFTSAKPVGKALSIPCPVCFVAENTHCQNLQLAGDNSTAFSGETRPPHPERARIARWTEMFDL
jgi:hypothetical protein